MPQFPEAYKQLLANGRSLRDIGLNEVGLSRADAIKAVGILRQVAVPILGGDVWRCGPNKLEYFGDWYTNAKPHETIREYTQRSYVTTISYIERISKPEDQDLWFVLTTPSEGVLGVFEI